MMVRIIILIWIWFAVSLFGTDFSSWDRSVNITFDGYTGSALTNFPVLLKFSDGDPSGFSYTDLNSDGSDFRFTGADMSTELNYEIDTWDTSGTSMIWVQVPVLASGTNIYGYWGSSGATSPSYTTDGSTWSNGYVAVWHMAQTNTATQYDSVNSYNAAKVGSPVSANGIVAKAVDFNGSTDSYDAGVVSSLDGISKATFSGWIFNDQLGSDSSNDSAIFGRGGNSSDTAGIILWANMDGGGSSSKHRYSFNIGNASGEDNKSNRINGSVACEAQDWQYVSATFNEAKRTLYVDGQFDAQENNGVQTVLPTSLLPLNLGTWPVASTMRTNGKLDELRVSSVDRSDAWIYAEWQNVASNSTFSTFGNVEPVSGTLFMFK